jgi:hypothetical protein
MNIKSVWFSVIVLGLLGCSTSQITAPTSPTMHTAVTQIVATIITPTSTPDFNCWKKEKECEIANSLGVNMEQIDSFSPDMNWAVITSGFGLTFVKTDSTKEWKFDSTQMSHDIGDCSLMFMTNFWSLDSHYVYFSPNPSYCSRLVNFSDEGTQVLYRLDVTTGKIIEYLPFVKGQNSIVRRDLDLYTLAFSPDGAYLAYFHTLHIPLIIHIRNLETGTETTYTMNKKYPEAGCLAWAGKKHLLFFYVATNTAPHKDSISSLYKIDIDNKSVKEIIHDQPYLYCLSPGAGWNNGDLIFTMETDIKSERGIENLYFNPYTEEFKIVPTSTP